MSQRSGVVELMEDLGNALTTNRSAILMGGGNPAQIPAMQEVWRAEMASLLAEEGDRFANVLSNYEPPAGNPAFRQALADYLRERCGWAVGPENLAITAGGQTALFYLLNLFGGEAEDGSKRKILLPLMPEYIGYANMGAESDCFVTQPASIELLGENRFKYHVDFDRLKVGDEVGAICVSRPTNPSGNVLTDSEIQRLSDLSEQHEIPLIIDNAYGLPFPGVIFTEAKPFWNPNVIQTLSLSKLGLPGTRTGIVVAAPEVIEAVSAMTAVTGLANNNFGQALVHSLVESGRLDGLSRDTIQPFYRERCQFAAEFLDSQLSGRADYRVHQTEGTFFLWLWMENLSITSRELYLRLKQRGVIVVPGEYFFFGLEEEWPHQTQCLRISYTQPKEAVAQGLEIIADEIIRLG